jgi:hypothetical protein
VASAWSDLAPISPIREVEAARKRVLELRDQIGPRREGREAAAAAVVQLERDDRTRMAELMAAGKPATSNVEAIEKARAASAGAQRALEALGLAIQTGEAELHAAIVKARDAWAKRAAGEVSSSRREAQEALAGLRAALARHQDARQVAGWLAEGGGLDHEWQVTPGLLPRAAGSQPWAANSEEVGLATVFGWIEQTVAEPEPELQAPAELVAAAAR